ncbi:two-component system sensor histidine kinase RppB [Aerosakkonema funiforme]|uniref:two-component system sensor histidine kinase RppB n=1 Tax=Aerosakkonema funiforme TaxID=1246630 RepID=UPI0035B8CAA2
MEQNQLFRRTRLRLASWYAVVMGCILGLSGLGVYHVVSITYQETIDDGLESVALALQKSIEPVLRSPNNFWQVAQQLSLKICHQEINCFSEDKVNYRQISEAVSSVNYYLRLVDNQGQAQALAGLPLKRLAILGQNQRWQTLKETSGVRYRQISLPLNARNQIRGYLQLGRSLGDLDRHLIALKLTLLLGYPMAMIMIAWSSWWLAGKAMQPVYHSYQQMEQFTGDAAHEFRTPIAAMASTIEAALKLYPEQEIPKFLATLKRQNNRLAQLTRDLLFLTRIEQHQSDGKLQPCCLNDLISDLVEELAFIAVETKVKLLAIMAREEPLYVKGNEEQLYRLVCNLIVNAIQATPSAGEVRIILNQFESSALIKVQDTGIGIAIEQQERIFDRFYRVDRDRSRQTGGSGLGLAIAQAIAHAHKGNIHVQSQLGRGSTFTVRLPLLLLNNQRSI